MQSRLYLFNVGNEVAISHADNRSYTPPRLIQKMRQDLATLPYYMANKEKGEAILIPQEKKKLALSFFDKKASLLTLEDIQKSEKRYQLELYGLEPPLERKLQHSLSGRLLPCGRQLSTLQLHSFFDRSLGQLFLQRYYPEFSPQVVSSYDQLLSQSKEYTKVVLKRPFTSSGRGVMALTKDQLLQTRYTQKLSYPLLMEPFYQVTSDWGAEYRITPDGSVEYLGLSSFKTEKFRYLYNEVIAQEKLERRLCKEVPLIEVKRAIKSHITFMKKEIAPYYSGNVGIDMMVFEGRLHPCCEINVRTTMGHYALALAHCFICRETDAFRFSILPFTSDSYRQQFCASVDQERIIPLTPIDEETQFVAVLARNEASL